MDYLQIATTIVGTLMSLAYFPQAYKMYQNKSAYNVSIPTFLLFGVGTVLWTIYGFSIKDVTLILSFIPGVIGSWLIIILAYKYKTNNVTESTN